MAAVATVASSHSEVLPNVRFICSIAFQQRDAIHRWRLGYRPEKGIYVRELLFRKDLGRVRRHLTFGLTNILGESRECQRTRSQAWSGASMSRVTMALIASILNKEFLTGLGISRWRAVGSRSLGQGSNTEQRHECQQG